MKSLVADFKSIKTTSDTRDRLALEEIFTNQQRINKAVREKLEEWYKPTAEGSRETPLLKKQTN